MSVQTQPDEAARTASGQGGLCVLAPDAGAFPRGVRAFPAGRSRRSANALVRAPNPAMTLISITPAVGWVATTRTTRACAPLFPVPGFPAPAAPAPSKARSSRSNWLRARAVVQGRICRAGRVPASASTSSRANACGQSAPGWLRSWSPGGRVQPGSGVCSRAGDREP